jgi:hypothetical protein
MRTHENVTRRAVHKHMRTVHIIRGWRYTVHLCYLNAVAGLPMDGAEGSAEENGAGDGSAPDSPSQELLDHMRKEVEAYTLQPTRTKYSKRGSGGSHCCALCPCRRFRSADRVKQHVERYHTADVRCSSWESRAFTHARPSGQY